MKRILVTGAAGQVGGELARLVWPAGYEVLAVDRSALDLTDTAAIARFVADHTLAAVINCAAHTAVDRAETEVVASWKINALAPAAFARATALAGIPLVQVSTDYVFDGSGTRPWEPSDPIGPLGVYGASKEGGEQAVRTANPRHAIVRTSWVVSPSGTNFVKTMLRLGAERPLLRVVDDQWGAPTVAADLAAALAVIAVRLVEDADAPTGTWHFANAGETTWCRLAREIFRLAAARGGPAPRATAIASSDYPTPARRPSNSRLSTATLTRDFGIRPRPWEEAIAEVVAALLPTDGQ